MNDIEKLRAMSRLKTIKLKDVDGVESEFKVRSMLPNEILLIMNSWGDKKASEIENMTQEEVEVKEFTEYINAVINASSSLLQRSYPELTEDERNEVITINLKTFMAFCTEQMNKFFASDDTRNVKKLRHARKRAN